ncbi:MAG: hypothetical protein ACO1QR_11100 [Chthoniobacteraceae bacterium]
MNSHWIKAIVALAGVWLMAGGVIFWAKASKPTPEKLERYVNSNPLDGKSAAERARTIEDVAEQLNGLSYEDRQHMRMGRRLDGFFRSLTPEEQGEFLDLTLPTGFKQMMEAFNNMDPKKRKRFVKKALEDMERDAERGEQPPVDDEVMQKMVEQGLRSYYSDASADVKMDLAPLIEQMQKNLQWNAR